MFLKNNALLRSLPLIVILLFLGVQISIGQTYIEEDTVAEETQKIDSATNFFSITGLNTIQNTRNRAIEGNSVFLTQIGSFNQVKVEAQTQASEINVVQNGSANYTKLDYTVGTAYANLVQNGNNNTIIDNVFSPQEDISLELTQEGDNITFERYGVNSITKSLKFKQTEASPTIIVRSFQ